MPAFPPARDRLLHFFVFPQPADTSVLIRDPRFVCAERIEIFRLEYLSIEKYFGLFFLPTEKYFGLFFLSIKKFSASFFSFDRKIFWLVFFTDREIFWLLFPSVYARTIR